MAAPPDRLTTNPLIARLRRLTGLSEDDLALLADAFGSTRLLAARSDIVPEGAVADHLHVVLDGWAARYRLLPDGVRQLTAILVPGDLCDLDGLLLRRVHVGVAALTPCKVGLVPLGALRTVMDRRPAIRDVLWWLTCVDNAISAEWSAGLGRRSTQERFAHLVCELLVRLTTVGLAAEGSYALPLTQHELGDALGVSAVHVNRTLQNLRGMGLLSLEGRMLRIHDRAALRSMAGFSDDYLHADPHPRAGPPETAHP